MEREVITIKDLKAEKLDEKVLVELKKGKLKKDIIATLHIGPETLNISISRLIRYGRITEQEIQSYKMESKKVEILKYLQEGYSKEEIRRKLHMNSTNIVKLIEELVKEGKIDAMYLEYGNGIRERNKSNVLKKLKEGNTITESAEILGMNKTTAYIYTRELVDEGRIKREEIVKKIRGKVVKQVEAKESKKKNVEATKKPEKKSKRMNENEMEKIVVLMLQNGLRNGEIAGELGIDFKSLRKIIDKALIEGKIKAPEKRAQRGFKGHKNINNSKETSNIERWRMAMNNIAQRFGGTQINEVDQKMYFMYCRRIVESGETLSNRELELLKHTIVYCKGDVNIDIVKFIGMQYLKTKNLTPAINLIDECINVRGANEELESAKKIFQDIQVKQESKLKEREEVER